MPIYCKLLTLCFDFNDSIIIQLSYIRAFTHKLPWLDQYRLILLQQATDYHCRWLWLYRYKTGKVASFGQPFLFVDLILSQNQIISFFTFFFSSEFSLMSNFS